MEQPDEPVPAGPTTTTDSVPPTSQDKSAPSSNTADNDGEAKPVVQRGQKDPEKLERQVRLYKRVALIAIVGCVAAFGWVAYSRRVSSPAEILLDGNPIVTVRNLTSANAVLLMAEREKAGGYAFPEDTYIPRQKVQFRRVAHEAAVDQDETAAHALAAKLKLNVRAYAILVDGHSTIALPTAEMAAQTLSVIKNHYESMPPADPVSGETDFVDKVVVERMGVDSSKLKTDPNSAAEYFWTPRQLKTYVVQRRDTGFSIARKSHISFSDFLSANAGRDLNRLHPGETVNISKTAMLIHVRVHKQMQTNESIISNVPASEAGRQRVTYTVIYVNGHEVKRRVLGMETLEKPRTRTSL